MTPGTLRLAASLLLALPMAALGFVAVAEVAGGDLTGSQHLVEAVPLLLILLAARRYPRTVGIALIALSISLFALWLVMLAAGVFDTAADTPVWVWLAVGMVLFALPLVSGVLFYLSSAAARIYPRA